MPLTNAEARRFGALASPWVAPVPSSSRQQLVAAITLFTAAFVLRGMLIGNPLVHVDEQFYLLVGQRMLDGALPYVDIWDRKPLGLFLINAAASALGNGLIASQVMAFMAALGTSWVITRIASRFAPPREALLGGLAYLGYLSILNCAGCQSPVFYNLPVAIAALIVIATVERAGDPDFAARDFARQGLLAMLLLGLAMQIKYTVVFEGVGLGLLLLAAGWRAGIAPRALARTASMWIAAALLPTALALGAYTVLGHAETFIGANFLSIFARETSSGESLLRLGKLALVLGPLLVAAILITSARWQALDGKRGDPARTALEVWAFASLAGLLVFGTWYDHYAAPLLVPFCALLAPALASRKARLAGRLALLVGAIGGLAVPPVSAMQRGNAEQAETAADLIAENLDGKCLYVFDGPPALYRLTGACLPSRYAFPSHLSSVIERNALDTGLNAEVRRIVATKPGVVVVMAEPQVDRPDPAMRAMLLGILARDYQPYAQLPIGDNTARLYRLKPSV